MANTRNKALAVRVRDPLGNIVTPSPLGVTLPNFTERALPYVLVEDDGQDVGNWGGLEKVAHTSERAPWDGRLVQHLVSKPLQAKQGYSQGGRARWYRTIHPAIWRDVYNCLDSLGFMKGDFCSPLGVYLASLLHAAGQCFGILGVCTPVPVHMGVDDQCGWCKLPHAVKDYILGRH